MTTATKAPPKPFSLRRDAEGWWFYVGHTNADEPWYGPWATKADAKEALRSWQRNNISSQRPCDIKSEWRGRNRRGNAGRKLPTRNELFTLSPQG
jgi:hypothetical protein